MRSYGQGRAGGAAMRFRSSRFPNTLTRGEQAIADLILRHRMTGPQIAAALGSTPSSIKVMVHNMRKKGVTIAAGGVGHSSIGDRSEARRVGKEWVGTCRDWWGRDLKKK